MLKQLLILFLLGGLLNCTVIGGVPDNVKQAFEQKYPDEKSPKWSVDDHGNYEAHFKKGGEKHRADFDSKTGAWIETEVSIKYKELPDVVKDAIKAEFDKDDITEVELVWHHSKGKFYDVEFKAKGKNHDVEYNDAGIIIGTEN